MDLVDCTLISQNKEEKDTDYDDCSRESCLDKNIRDQKHLRYFPYHFPTASKVHRSIKANGSGLQHQVMKKAKWLLKCEITDTLKEKALEISKNGNLRSGKTEFSLGDLLQDSLLVEGEGWVNRKEIDEYWKVDQDGNRRLSVVEEISQDLKHLVDDDDTETHYWVLYKYKRSNGDEFVLKIKEY